MIVIGVGNEFRRDDAAGLVAASRLRDRGVQVEEHGGDLLALIDRWKGFDDVVLIDAVSSGSPPGTIHRIDVSASPLPREISQGSTHALGLADTVELSRTLGTLPKRILIFGVEVENSGIGAGLSPTVDRAVSTLVEEVVACTKRP